MSDLQTLRARLGGTITNGQLLCSGPGHSPKDRSLSIKLDSSAPDGFIVHSFAGDDPIECKDYVREKAKLEPFKPNSGNGRQRASDAAIERALAAAVAAQSRPENRVVATYDYTNADGTLLYQVLRLEPKGFRQRRPDGNGGWIWNLDDVRRVVYRLPELLQYPNATIFVTEGEKDADRVAALGHCATTAAGSKWTDYCVIALARRDVIILQDNDEPGAKKALAAAQALHGTTKTIRIVLLPNLPDGGDVSDWLDADPRRAEQLVDRCFDVPIWTPQHTATLANDCSAIPPSPDDMSHAELHHTVHQVTGDMALKFCQAEAADLKRWAEALRVIADEMEAAANRRMP